MHAITLADDGLLYVCDRTNDRIQVFKTDGTYVDEVFVAKNTLGDGSTFDVALSRDPEQKYLYVADGANMKIHVLNRKTLEVLTTFGDGGRQPGQFYAVHSVATDLAGQSLYDRDLPRPARAEVHLQGRSARRGKEPGEPSGRRIKTAGRGGPADAHPAPRQARVPPLDGRSRRSAP